MIPGLSVHSSTRHPRRLDAEHPLRGPARRRRCWLDVDWREHQRWVRADGRPDQHDRPRRGPAAACSCTGCRAAGRTGSSSSPCSPASTGSSRVDLPGFGHSPMPAERDHDLRLRAHRSTRCWASSASSAAAVVGNSMGGFIARRARDRLPAAGRAPRARLGGGPLDPPAAAHRARASRAAPAGARARVATRRGWRRTSDTVARRPRLREATLEPRRAPPAAACRPRSPPSSCAARASPASCRRWRRRRLRPARAPPRDRLPDADRVGRRRTG